MIRIAICTALAFSLATPQPILARDRTFVPVASYLDRPDLIEKEGKQAATILNKRNLITHMGHRLFDEAAWAKWTSVHGADSLVIFVPKDESTEARLILARAIKAERLRITLRADDGATISPDSILEPSKKP